MDAPHADLPGANPANGDETEHDEPHPDAEPDLEQPTVDVAPDPWRCPRCGSARWVAASLNGGATRIRQCVPCGHYSGDLVPG